MKSGVMNHKSACTPQSLGILTCVFPFPRSHALCVELQKTISSPPSCWQNEENLNGINQLSNSARCWLTNRMEGQGAFSGSRLLQSFYWPLHRGHWYTVPLIQGRVSRGDGKGTGWERQELKRSTDWNCNREEIMLFGHWVQKKKCANVGGVKKT